MKNLLFLLILPIFSLGQGGYYNENKSDISIICDFYRGNSFASNITAENALKKILNVTGMSKRFVLHSCNNIDNCLATSYRGIRYILYDKSFMKEIAENTSSWSNLSILAHEIGHHVNGHSIDLLSVHTGEIKPPSLPESRKMEIEADEFSGFVMQKLGASLNEAQEAIRKYASSDDDSYSTHPSKQKRLDAIERGYNRAKTNDFSKLNNKPSLSAEDYFYKAENLPERQYNLKIDYYSMAIQLNLNYKFIAFNNRGFVKQEQGDYNGAIDDYSKAIMLCPLDVELKTGILELFYQNRIKAKTLAGDYNGAVYDCNKALSIYPKNFGFLFNKALINKIMNKPYCNDLKKSCDLGYEKACLRYDEFFCRWVL